MDFKMIKKHTAVLAITLVCMLFFGCNTTHGVRLPVLELEALPPSGSDLVIRNLSLSESFNADINRNSALVFKTKPIEVDEDYILSLKDKLGLDGCSFINNDDTMGVADGNGNSIFVFKASGSIVYSSDEEDGLILKEVEALYSNEEYIEIARTWLYSVEMLTDDYLEKMPEVAENGFVTKTGDDGRDYSYPTLKTVTYMYKDLDGVKVSGVAPRIIVDVSLDGKVVSATKIQRGFTPLDEYPLCSIEDAIKKLENGDGVFYASGDTGSEGVIESVELAYYNKEVMDDFQYLIPVYIFKGSSEGTNFSAIVFALEEETYTILWQ